MRAAFLFLTILLLSSCAGRIGKPREVPPPRFTASDGKDLPIRIWNLQREPDTVIVGLHGISGAAKDYENLGKSLARHSSGTTLYALNLRGQGYDPQPSGRGDIRSARLWERDLQELHRVVKARHPRARIVWMGESMGSLIALHAAAGGPDQPDALILASPIVSLEKMPRWQRLALRTAARFCPRCKVSLKTLAGGNFEATGSGNHFEQVKKNPYQIDLHTLRFLATLGRMADGMIAKAPAVKVPVLVLHGGRDPLGDTPAVIRFTAAFPVPAVRVYSPRSHHLLFYDKDRNEVIARTLRWLGQTPAVTP